MLSYNPVPLERGIFCNRTLNLKKIQAIGYDMDYTLIHYNVSAWEGRAYEQIKRDLLVKGWPVEELKFDPQWAVRGLVIDCELGNIVKVNRFGYVKQACHGMKFLDFETTRQAYQRIVVDLAESRYVFINTLFSISEACLYCQLVDLLDAKQLPVTLGYADLYKTVHTILNQAHYMEGELKHNIIATPEQYVILDPELPYTLLDQKHAGKKLMLITNSDWDYTKPMMEYAFQRFLPKDISWQDLFDLIIISADKPGFFSSHAKIFQLIPEDGSLRVCRTIDKNGIYFGGNATCVENFLKVSGEEILYVGDHIFADVNISKSMLRWRTALIVRELEDELRSVAESNTNQEKIHNLMENKERLEYMYNQILLAFQRIRKGYKVEEAIKHDELDIQLKQIRNQLQELDTQLQPLVIQEEKRTNPHWGYMMRTGNDKSHLMRQIEKYADIYTSRVSNFLSYTPFMYFRSPRGSMPHDLVAYKG